MEVWEKCSVKIIRLNKLPSKVLSHDLGTRRVGALGVVTSTNVSGLDSDAIHVEHREAFGEKTGEWGIYFFGEFEPIPDLLSQ